MPSSPKMPEKNLIDENQPSTLENAISVVLGLAVVLVIGAMIVNTIRGRNKTQEPAANTETKQEEQATTTPTPGGTYTVQPGDTLWSIAEKTYNDGFKWTEIKKANNLPTNDIEKDQKLALPNLTTAEVASGSSGAIADGSTGPTGGAETLEPPSGQTLATSTDKTYTVVHGDNLWNIAVAKYGNGYKWVDIAKANNLANPSLIHAGNVLTLP